ncbi:MAG: hypothetical protein Q7S59_06905 [Sulfurimonas sp.]|nr:hypothetical protein [Sulfurimonas sp.]
MKKIKKILKQSDEDLTYSVLVLYKYRYPFFGTFFTIFGVLIYLNATS